MKREKNGGNERRRRNEKMRAEEEEEEEGQWRKERGIEGEEKERMGR